MIDASSQPQSPINELPIDILCEIFSRCGDPSSMQPDNKIAPMLLCHVCAPWRALVLATPPLWSHLRVELPLSWYRNGRPYAGHVDRFARRMEWLRWWRRNLRGVAPYLAVELWREDHLGYRYGRLSAPTCEFLLELMASAQYLSVGGLYRYLVQRRREAGYTVRLHPSAHTIVSTLDFTSPHLTSNIDDSDAYNQYVTSVLTQTRSTLRHLVIEHIRLSYSFADWSMLTHLSIRLLSVYLDAWFTFIRSLNALQSASFHVSLQDDDINVYTRPPAHTLPSLSHLHMGAARCTRPAGQYPLQALFAGLALPALRTLSLTSQAKTWHNTTALPEVHAALRSAPGVTSLALGTAFLGHLIYGASAEALGLQTVGSDAVPLRVYAPRLERLRFALASPLRARGAFDFLDRAFAPGHWLDLQSAESTVRGVTFVMTAPCRYDTDGEEELADRRLFIAEVRRFVRDDVDVGFAEEDPADGWRTVWGW